MTEPRERQGEFEPDRHELAAAPAYDFGMDRREFFRRAGSGLALLCLAPSIPAQRSPSGAGTSPRAIATERIDAWLHIGEQGAVSVFTGKVEVGQNIRTSLAQAVAEELRVPLESIEMVMGDTDRVPFDRGTFGSRTTPDMAPRLRRAAAAAREVLAGLAAERWQADRSVLSVEGGQVVHRQTGASIGFGQLTRGRELLHVISPEVPTAPPAEWTVAGRSVPKLYGRAFVTGTHRYASDLTLPGMLRGKVLRPPAFGAELVSLDSRRAEDLPGVTVVRDGNFVGVAAPDEAAAERALAALRAEWRTTPQPSAGDLFARLRGSDQARSGGRSGDLDRGWAQAQSRLSRSYLINYIAHAPLEPRAALARWEGGRLTVWTGTQRPFGVRSELASAFGISEERVRVIMPDTGSAYGGKHTGEAAIEAARLARTAGRPVSLVWTREEEFTWAYFRPAGVIDVESGCRADGTITAWEFDNYNSGSAGLRSPYAVPNERIAYHPARSPLRQGSYRALASTANHFARETQIDEMAGLVGMDPLKFRLRNLRDGRIRAVLEAAAGAFGWGRQPDANRGFGIACGTEKGGYVGTCAEVAVDPAGGAVKVLRVVAAFECGAIVNPAHLQSQVEGCVLQGLGGALFESIEFDNGRILNPTFARYRVPRFSDTPELETVLLDRPDLPSAGAGEAPIIAIAPAIGNAIHQATGIRLRSLPLAPSGVA